MREQIIFDFIEELTMAMYGRQMYIKNENGTYFSKISDKELKNIGEVVDEIMGIIRNDYE